MSTTTTASASITVAVAGNPNCGKTTVFNGLTGGRRQIGNWPGVTVEKKEGRFTGRPVTRILAEPFSGLEEEPTATVHTGNVWDRIHEPEHIEFRVVDPPGIYSLSASSEDGIVARDYLTGGEPDLVVDVIDASNIERNLYLTMQLAEMGLPVVAVLTMTDVAEKKSIHIDLECLRAALGVPVIAINALHRGEMERLKAELIELAHHRLGGSDACRARATHCRWKTRSRGWVAIWTTTISRAGAGGRCGCSRASAAFPIAGAPNR